MQRTGRKLIDQYGLEHWDIEWEIDTDPEPDSAGGITYHPDYWTGSMTICSARTKDTKDLEETVRHEFEHVLSWPYASMFNIAKDLFDEPTRTMWDGIRRNAEELQRQNIGRLRARLLNKK